MYVKILYPIGNYSDCIYFIKIDCDENSMDEWCNIPKAHEVLLEASETDDLHTIELLINKYSHLFFSIGGSLKFALEIASKTGNIKSMELLIRLGADNFNSAFRYACLNNKLECAEVLLHKYKAGFHDSLVIAIVKRGYIDILKFLTKVRTIGIGSMTEAISCIPLYTNSSNEDDMMSIIKYLIECGVNNLDEAFKTSLVSNDLKLMKYLNSFKLLPLKGGVYIHYESALYHMTGCTDVDCIKYIIELNDVNENTYKIIKEVIKHKIGSIRKKEQFSNIKTIVEFLMKCINEMYKIIHQYLLSTDKYNEAMILSAEYSKFVLDTKDAFYYKCQRITNF